LRGDGGAGARLLPAGALAHPGRLPAAGRLAIVNLHVAFDRPVTDLAFAAGIGTPVQWVFDRTAAAGLRDGQLLAVSLSAAAEEARMRADALRDRYVPALRALLPRARDARVEAFLPAGARHLEIAKPGGPVLVPAKDADALQIVEP